jgi:formamidopyrimidine-DNA glycosylase
MPELPEVETVRAGLATLVTESVITGIELRDFPGVIGELDVQTFSSLIVGSRILRIDRRGKYLLIVTDGPASIQIHLRMTGRIIVTPAGAAPIRFEHLAIHLDNGSDLRFGDQRKFGRVTLVDAAQRRALYRRLGPEPLAQAMTASRLHRSLARRTGKIKSVLLDQTLIAGLGNIYVDEALFRSRIHPETVPAALTLEQCAVLLRAIRKVLRLAIDNQGTTFSTFENPYGESGSNSAFLLVYGKGGRGMPCPRCGTLLERITVGGRGTTFCPHCQVRHESG